MRVLSDGTSSLFCLLLATVGTGCYRPAIEACQLQCNDRRCPSGLACNDQGFCASSSSTLCESLPVDGAIDADSSRVTIEVRDQATAPVAGAVVIFADRGGAQLAEITTGADGIASLEMPPFGSATVMRTAAVPPLGLIATTYLQLWPGAHIISQPLPDGRTRSVNVEWTASPGSNMYEVRTSCGTPAVTVPAPTLNVNINVPVRCSTFDVIVHAGPTNAANMPPSVVRGGQTGASVVMPSTWTPAVSVPVTITGRPTNAATVTATLAGWVTPGVISTATFSSTAVPPSGVTTLSAPAGVNLTPQFKFQCADPLVPATTQTVIERLPAGVATYTRNYDNTVMPWAAAAAFDVNSRLLSWAMVNPTAVTPATPKVVFAEISFTRGATRYEWRVIAPGTLLVATTVDGGPPGVSLQFPDVPGDRMFEPLGSDMITSRDATLIHVDDAAVHGTIEQYEPHRLEVSAFVPAIGHLTFETTP